MTNLGLLPLEYLHYTRKIFIIVVKSTENFVFKNGSCSVDQRTQHFLKQKTLLVWTLQPTAGFTLSLVSEVRIVRVFI